MTGVGRLGSTRRGRARTQKGTVETSRGSAEESSESSSEMTMSSTRSPGIEGHAFASLLCFFAAVAIAHMSLHALAVHHSPFTGFLPVQFGLRQTLITSSSAMTAVGVGYECVL